MNPFYLYAAFTSIWLMFVPIVPLSAHRGEHPKQEKVDE